MMQKLKLIATKALRYNTRSLVAGDEFDAPDMHARLLIGIGKARYAPEKKPEKATAQPVKPPEKAEEKPPPAVEPVAQEHPGDLNQLRAEAQRLGIEVDGRWGDIRLRNEIAQARK